MALRMRVSVPLLVLAFLVGCIAKKPARNEQDPILQRLEELERRVSEQDKHLKRQAELEKRVLEQDAKLQEFDKRLLDKDAKLLEQDAKLQRLSELEGRVQRQEQEIQDQKETILKLDSELQQLKTKQRTDDGPEEESTGEYPTKDEEKRSDDTSAWEPVVSQISSQMTQLNAEIQVLKTATQSIGTSYVQWGHDSCPNSSEIVYSALVLSECWDKPRLKRLDGPSEREIAGGKQPTTVEVSSFSIRLKVAGLSVLAMAVSKWVLVLTLIALTFSTTYSTKVLEPSQRESNEARLLPTDDLTWNRLESLEKQMKGYALREKARDRKIEEQDKRIRELKMFEERVTEQETKIQQLEQEIRDQKEVEKRVTEQEAKIQQLKQEIRDQKGIENRVTEQEMKIKQQERESREQKDAILLLENQLQRMRTEKQKRSDDTSAWEPVVSQMSSQMTQMNAEIQVLKTVNQQQDQTTQNAVNKLNQAIGTSYVRWGHGACPNSSEIFYSVLHHSLKMIVSRGLEHVGIPGNHVYPGSSDQRQFSLRARLWKQQRGSSQFHPPERLITPAARACLRGLGDIPKASQSPSG
ncbi:hypothetical protein BaRGS_00013095, partial [Batillaria attramentaria]